MPIIYGCYISNRDIKKDRDFLASQGLSEQQVAAIERYWQRRMCANSYLVGFTSVLFLFFGALGYMAWEPVKGLIAAGVL